MAYVLTALIAKRGLLDTSGLQLVELPQDMVLAPLIDAFWKQRGLRSQPLLSGSDARAAPDSDFDDVELVGDRDRSRAIAEACESWSQVSERFRELSASGSLAYVEAHSFGGHGGKAAAVWERGRLSWGPIIDADAINAALAKIGVIRAASDEYDALGLGRCRFTDEWLTRSR